MDHGVWHQARDAGGRLYFFNDAGETRWDWPGGEAAPLAVQNAFAGALQQPVVPGGNAPISRELAERCLGEMRRDKAELARLEGELAAAADRDSQLDAQFAAAVADRAALATAAAESRRAAADRALSCATAALADAWLATEARLPDVEAAWARAWPAPAPAPPPDDDDLRQLLDGDAAAPPAPMETDDDDDLARALAMSREEAPPPPPEDEDIDGDGMAFDPALLQPATRWPGPTGGDSTDDDTPPSPAPARPTRAPKRPKKLEDAAPAPKKRARVSTDGAPLARDPPGATAAAPDSIMATVQGQLSDTLYSKKQILELMPNGQGSHVPAVYAAGGVIYALCFSEDSNPGLPTVVEISCGTQRRKQVTQFQELQRRRGTVPLFVCLKTARGRLELLPSGSGSKGFRFAGMRSVVSVETHSTPKMVGGEARQATVTLSAPTAGETCPLQVAGIPRAIQVAGAPAPAPAPPAAPPVTPAPAPPPRPAAPVTPAQPRMVTSGAVWSEGAASGVMVRCPEGVGVGQTLMFEHSESGRKFKVVVPAGVAPGQEFRVPLPS
ncbi:unnamed protein product [Pelagomonas calceolata]|uniref:WW domain-containing protein n=2 Tax=Pelagomonas calceolata TaxID=35677 RepID=A0A8J2SP33_9STRA|nr:unnamed protein product [Pelagomonas calceolata]